METLQFILLWMVLPAGLVVAQDTSRTPYFPYQTGDFWVYEEYSQVKQEIVNEIKYRVYADSTDGLGTRWVFVETNDNRRIDSVYYRIKENGDIYSNEYYNVELRMFIKAATNLNEAWVGGIINFSGSEEEEYAVFTLKGLENRTFFGESRERRILSLTVTNDTTASGWNIEIYEDTWTESFGITGRGDYEGGNQEYMKGVWKNGVVYGDTTFRQIALDTLRTDFFPYETDDFWVYDLIRDFGNPSTEKVKYRVYADSVSADSTKWVHVEKNVNGAIDSVYYKVMANGDVYSDDLVGEEMLKFKFEGVAKGDYWIGGEIENGNYGVFQLRNVGIYDVPNTPQSVSEDRSIYYHEMSDTVCCNNRIFRESWVAGFGIMSINFFDDPDTEAWSIVGVYKNGQVYGDTTFAVIASREPVQEIPSAFTLRQNYPNPFNPSTIIEYEVSGPTNLSVTLYTYTGQKITEIYTNKFLQPGSYTLKIDQRILGNVASSLLILKVQTQNEVQYLKMTYLK